MPVDSNCEAAYLDNNATSPVAEEVLAAMVPWFRAEPGNPSSLHGPGERAHAAISKARKQVAVLLGARSPKQVHFTSGGTESINSALYSALLAGASQGRHLAITSTVEHPATAEYLSAMAKSGAWSAAGESVPKLQIAEVQVDKEGRLDVKALLDLLSDQGERCCVVSLLLVNNETGHVLSSEDIRTIGDATHRAGALLHLDAVQAAGKLPLALADLPVDYASISGHKFHGPKGIGALYVRGEAFHPLLHGGPQESERRAGTENVPAIVGLGEAAALGQAYTTSPEAMAITTARRDRLEVALLAALAGTRVAGAGAKRVGTATCIEFPGVDGEAALLMLSHMQIAVSTGSACGSTHHAPSHVLLAMGRTEDEASSSLRFSLSRETTDAEVDLAISAVPVVIEALRSLSAGIEG